MKRTGLALAVLVALALLLELTLQVGHGIVVWRHGRSLSPTAGKEGTTVLCIGDSFTFGVGAASPQGSYPAALERLLQRELGPGVSVVNAGWPGQNSYEVAEQLDRELVTFEPDYVLILVGMNDSWRHASIFAPPATAAGEAPPIPTRVGSFRLEWRTLRLLQLLRQRLAPATASSLEGGAPPDSAPLPQGTEAPGVKVAPTPPADEKPTRTAYRLIDERDYEAALRVAEEGIASGAEGRVELEKIRIECLVRLGRRQDAIEATTVLEQLYQEDPTPHGAEALVGALNATGEKLRAFEIAQELVRDHPDAPIAWRRIADHYLLAGDRERAIWALERMLECDLRDSWRAKTTLALARTSKGDTNRAIRLVVDAVLLGADPSEAASTVRAIKPKRPDETIVAYAATLGLSPQQHARVESLLREVEGGDWEPPLRANLEQIVAMAQRAGSVPVVLAYPRGHASRRYSIQAEVAARTASVFVDPTARFAAELRTRPSETLFAADGHCTADGYAILAEEAAAPILASERR